MPQPTECLRCRGPRSTRSAADGISCQGGAQLMLATDMQGIGYAVNFHVALEGVS